MLINAEMVEQKEPDSNYADGVVCQEKWDKEKIKVLFVLKEIDSDEAFNLCEFLADGASGKIGWRTWNNVTRWAQALLDGGAYQKEITTEYRQKYLTRIAAINLKNTPGGAVADTQEVRNAALSNADDIRERITAYHPNIIICCGRGKGKNAYVLGEIFGLDDIPWEKEMVGNSWYYYLHLDNGKQSAAIPVISFCHPQMWGGHEKFQNRFDDMLEIRKHFFDK